MSLIRKMIVRAREIDIIPIEEAYNHLAKSIVIQAITDYREVLNNQRIKKLSKAKYNKAELEKFFRSEWYRLLSDLDGERLISLIKEQENYNDATD